MAEHVGDLVVRRLSKSMISAVAVIAVVSGGLLSCTNRMSAERIVSADSIDDRVALLINRALNARSQKAQQAAFSEIEKLGCAAVPAIIKRMDDRSPLPVRYIALENKSPQAFEAMRQYRPEQMVDALAALLNQLTGQDFEFIYSGASDEARAKAVAEARDFLRRTPTDRLCSGLRFGG